MANTLGSLFRLTTWGESHGPGIGCVVDGCPSGLSLGVGDIQKDLDRRRPGQSKVATARNEPDAADILSGVFQGKTTGAPISIVIDNVDSDSTQYEKIRDLLRPSQSDFSWREKYGNMDYRGGGRASGRETATRVAGGAVAKKLLSNYGIEVLAYSKEIAGIVADPELDYSKPLKAKKLIESNSVRCPDIDAAAEMEHAIMKAKEEKDSVGGVIEIIALNVPSGFGEPLFNKLGSDLASALLSIPGVKGFEVGAGFELARMRGSQANDAFTLRSGKIITSTNNSGGILGGISTGMPIVLRIAVKPTASIASKQKTVDYRKKRSAEIEVLGRHDPCIVPRAVPVAEAMTALVLADHGLISGFIPRRIK